MQRSPKAMLLRPTNVDLSECDCHLPTMESAGRRSHPVTSTSLLPLVEGHLIFLIFTAEHTIGPLLSQVECEVSRLMALAPRERF